MAPNSHFAAKATVSSNPFAGRDEQGYVAGVGSAETYRAFLQIYARRLALVLKDDVARGAFLTAIDNADKQEANIADVLSSKPELLTSVASGFLKDVTDANLSDSQLPDLIGANDQDAFLSVGKALYGLEVSLIDPAGTYQGQDPIDVFHNSVLDEKDTEYWEGFDPDGMPVQETFSMDGFQRTNPLFYIHFDENFFYKPENQSTTTMASPSPKVRPSLFSGLG